MRKKIVKPRKKPTKKLETNKRIPKKIDISNFKGLYMCSQAIGVEVPGKKKKNNWKYTGAVKLLFEDSVIYISVTNAGQPVLSIYGKKDASFIGQMNIGYFPVIDEKGKVTTDWKDDEDYPKPKLNNSGVSK